MNNPTEYSTWEKWYPLTYPGYYGADRAETSSFEYEHCRLDLSRFRGKTVFLNAKAMEEDDSFCTLTDDKGAVLEQWSTPPEKLFVPENALHLYLNNHYANNPDFHLLVPMKAGKKQNPLLFDENFMMGSTLDGNDFLGACPAKDCTPQGLPLPIGMENAVVIHKATAFDDWCLTAEVTAPEGTEAICLGSRITQTCHAPRHASLCCVDLEADELRIYRGNNGSVMPEEILQRTPLSGLIAKGEFILRLERVNLDIRATVINPATGNSVSVTHPIEDENAPIPGSCKAGKIFDSPQIFALSGSPLVRRLYGAAKANPKVIFFGDSITQGAHNMPEKGWAQMCAAHIGDSICCGRGSGDIWCCLNQVRTALPTLRPKAMVVTIGANNREPMVSLETVKGLYEKFIHMAENWGVILILNRVTSCRPHIDETNRNIQSLGHLGSRFDLALIENNTVGGTRIPEYYAKDQVHLSTEGNKQLHKRFMADFSWLRDL